MFFFKFALLFGFAAGMYIPNDKTRPRKQVTHSNIQPSATTIMIVSIIAATRTAECVASTAARHATRVAWTVLLKIHAIVKHVSSTANQRIDCYIVSVFV